LFSSAPPSTGSLSPYFWCLRHLVDPSPISKYEWRIPGISIYLLELRAALIVRDYADDSGNSDIGVNQRVANAVTEAFVAMQVGNMIQGLGHGINGQIVEKLLLLVSFIF
jgi:acyl-CoA oxidase